MKLLLILFTLISSVSALSSDNNSYSAMNPVKLSVRGFAHQFCTCLYSLEQSKEECEKYTFEEGPIPKAVFRISIDNENQSVNIANRLTANLVNASAELTEEGDCKILD